MSAPFTLTPYGFKWGPVEVSRAAHVAWGKSEHFAVRVNNVDVYVSRTGRSVRVFRGGKELS